MTFVVTRPSWTRWAACRGRLDLFYDLSPASEAVAKGVCARCGVRAQCLAEALVEEADQARPFGVRGGLSASERGELNARPVAS